jgi:hypothetical protein
MLSSSDEKDTKLGLRVNVFDHETSAVTVNITFIMCMRVLMGFEWQQMSAGRPSLHAAVLVP